MTELSSADCFEIWKQFISRWPIEHLQNLTLEEYTSLGSKDSFCYWLESKTENLGSMWGGSAFKFGIFEYNKQNDKETENTYFLKDARYKWMKKYGSTAVDAFKQIKEIILKIANAANSGNFELIDDIDLGQVTKWKLAFLYQNQSDIKIPCVYKEESLRAFLGNHSDDLTVSVLYKEILKKNTENKDIFAFSKTIWTDVAEKTQNAWLMAPGEGAYLLNDFLDSGMTKIGWNEAGDLSAYTTKDELSKSLRENFDEYKTKSPGIVTGMLWEFCNEIKIGDVIYLKKGTSQIVGRGIVKSEYKKLENGKYQHARDVEWTHIGTWNFSFPGAQKSLLKLNPDKFKHLEKLVEQFSNNPAENWFPSDYTPGFSVEDWKNLLNDPEIFNNNCLEIMVRMQDFGGIATCKQLSDKYGESANFYNSGSSYLAKRIHDKTSCPVLEENTENSRWWPILYVGRYNEDKNVAGSYLWKLRPELAEALKQIDLSDIKLYANGENNAELTIENPMITELKDLLLSSKQIILTGAPGTGKTYLAKQVAKVITEKEENIAFCQFHPSFDYTDFVEGLRPIDKGNGNIGFERKDGIFKAFCQKALKNYLDSQKSKQVIEAERSAQEKIDSFLNEAVEKQTRFKTTNGNEFYIFEFNGTQIFINVPQNASHLLILSYQEILKIISENIDIQKAGDIKRIFKRTHDRQSDSYIYIICSEIRKQKNISSAVSQSQVKQENFVFIIDEINRGDISKIFGELFYAVDPGYRGKDGKVTTQYDNLIDETDLYYGGFYIPKNVYIIGTMNDIDRSVESMDFAIRRRFTWKEIEAKDAVGMWDNEIPEYKEKAFEVMTRLNQAIEQTESLSKAFHIGPAYFLKLKEYKGDFSKLWDLHIMPLLKEYLRGTFDAETALENLRTAYFGTSDSGAEE